VVITKALLEHLMGEKLELILQELHVQALFTVLSFYFPNSLTHCQCTNVAQVASYLLFWSAPQCSFSFCDFEGAFQEAMDLVVRDQ